MILRSKHINISYKTLPKSGYGYIVTATNACTIPKHVAEITLRHEYLDKEVPL